MTAATTDTALFMGAPPICMTCKMDTCSWCDTEPTRSGVCAWGLPLREARACSDACTSVYILGIPGPWPDAGTCWPASCDADLFCTWGTSFSLVRRIQHSALMVFLNDFS